VEKFEAGKFLKCRFDCCDFIEVTECIYDSGRSAEVKAIWYTQMSRGWRQVSIETQFRISERTYGLWKIYTPRGEKR